MSEQAILWILGLLVGALFALVGAVYRNIIGRINRIDSGALAQFIAKDIERERQWMFWRDEVNKRLDAHAESSRQNTERIIRLERNGH